MSNTLTKWDSNDTYDRVWALDDDTLRLEFTASQSGSGFFAWDNLTTHLESLGADVQSVTLLGVPEPGSILMWGAAAAVAVAWGYRRRKS